MIDSTLFIAGILVGFFLFSTLVCGLVVVFRRGRAARQQLAIDLHDRNLALDQRADLMSTRIETVRLGQRLAFLETQLRAARRRGVLSPPAADRLDDVVIRWQAEHLETADRA